MSESYRQRAPNLLSDPTTLASVKRAGESVETRRVKLADLKHNMDLTRLGEAEPNLTRIGDYIWAYDYLLGLDID